MGKLYLYYSKHNDSKLGDFLKVKIDEEIKAEVEKNSVYEVELIDGQHNIKMYHEGWSENELVGYIDRDIEIKGDTFYVYKPPMTIYGKGKLEEKKYSSPEEFKKSTKKTNLFFKILSILLIVAGILMAIFWS